MYGWLRWLYRQLLPLTPEWRPTMPFQPLLYTAVFISTVLYLVFGDLWGQPIITRDTTDNFGYLWATTALTSPPLTLASSWMIQNRKGTWRYRGFWLRLAADTMMGAALSVYTLWRTMSGDFHLLPIGVMIAATIFTFGLIGRDIKTLAKTEVIANRLIVERNHHAQPHQ